MTQQFLQGPRSRKPLSSTETRNYRLGAWLHDQYSPWSAAQSSETQGTLQADTIPSIAPPDSPLLSSITSASSCFSDYSAQQRVSVPPPVGLSDPASLTGNAHRSTALLAGTGTWFATLSSRPKKSPEACCLDLIPPQLRLDPHLNASFREILFNNPGYYERLSRTIQDLPLEDRHNLLGQSLDPIASLGGGDSTVRHHAGSRRASASVTPATHRPTPSPCASNKRKTPPGGNQQDPGKAPNDSPGSGSGGGSASSPSQMKKPKTSDFQYLCPYRQVYHFMDPQRKFRSCQPPGHMKDRSQFKKHLKEVHVRFSGSPNANLNPDYSMDEDLWDNTVVGIFGNAQSKRFKRGSEDWRQNEEDFYQELWKTILPNAQPISSSPFYQDSVKGHPLVDEARRMLKAVFKEKASGAVQNGQVTSVEDYRPSQEEAMDMMAVPLAAILNASPELSQRASDLSQSQSNSDRLLPLTEDTRSPTPAMSSHDQVPGMNQGLPPPTATTTRPHGITDHTSFTDLNGDQQGEACLSMEENSRPDSPSLVLLDNPPNSDIPFYPQQASKHQVYIHVNIDSSPFEITLTGYKNPDYIGPQQWIIPVPDGLMATVKTHQLEPFTHNGGTTTNLDLEPGVPSLNSQLPSTGESSWGLEDGYSDQLKDAPPNLFGGAYGTLQMVATTRTNSDGR